MGCSWRTSGCPKPVKEKALVGRNPFGCTLKYICEKVGESTMFIHQHVNQCQLCINMSCLYHVDLHVQSHVMSCNIFRFTCYNHVLSLPGHCLLQRPAWNSGDEELEQPGQRHGIMGMTSTMTTSGHDQWARSCDVFSCMLLNGKACVVSKSIETSWNITIFLDLWLIFDYLGLFDVLFSKLIESSCSQALWYTFLKGCWGSLGDTSRKKEAANPFIAPASVNFTMPCPWEFLHHNALHPSSNPAGGMKGISSAIKWPRWPFIHLKRQHRKWCEHANTGKTFHRSSTADLHCFSQTRYAVSPRNDIVMVSGDIWDQEVVQCVPTCDDTVALQSSEKR